MVTMDNVVVPRPPALPGSRLFPKTGDSVRSRTSNGFRLVDDQGDSGSVYSTYKQRIDAMFESDSSATTKNSVQARIEKMFTDVAEDNGIPLNGIGCHTFSVDYLGSVALQEKVTSLVGLQTPLRELYFTYKKTNVLKQPLSGRLEISSGGLKVQYQGEKGDLEQLNSFPTIAVWSAVKFVLHEDDKHSYAFLPLITDPDNIDKQTLFRALDDNERKFITEEAHSPLFAVVMRKIGLHRQLECHAFVCQTPEDAIVIAATLYKSLMAHMNEKQMKPKSRNGITCMSVASSAAVNENGVPVRPPRKKRSSSSSVNSDRDAVGFSDTQPLLETKSPRKSSKTRKAPKAPSDPNKPDLDAILPFDEHDPRAEPKPPTSLAEKWNTFMSAQQKQITAEIKQVLKDGSNAGLKRAKSVRKRSTEGAAQENSGDILTKVTIPRSGSFLNAGGLTRYKSKVYKANGQASGGSPLGFSELFNEFRLQEGLHSVDEILGAIIDPEGMSFNDLKPIYKEFLLKLAVTLTKDELYQRSKAIMRRQKKKLTRRNSNAQTNKRTTVVSSRFKRLRRIFRKLPRKEDRQRIVQPSQSDPKLPESSISTSSYDTRHFKPKEPPPVTRKQSYRKKTARRERASTSEESDFFSVRRSKTRQGPRMQPPNAQTRNSSSGYVSCSECSYDSDTCTCTSADKCYCSLGHRHLKPPPPQTECYCNAVWCGCDTDSCTESNKCYCQAPAAEKTGTIFEQLKRRGFIPAASAAVTPPYHRRLCKRKSNTKSTRSLEYMPNPSEKYYEKLRNRARSMSGAGRNVLLYDKRKGSVDYLTGDYEFFGVRCPRSVSGAVEVYRGSVSSRNSARCGSKGKSMRSREITETCSEALSVKKSAEIAALFADIKLSQTTDITHLVPKKHKQSGKTVYSNLPPNFDNHVVHNSLYYSSKAAGNNMYSTKNGLYTIQSQSDDSKHSSRSGKGRKSDYFTMESQCENKNVSSSLENSLGYLP